MANANELMGYLPVSFKSTEEQNYINFLWESYESNYNNGKYPFAFIAFHMLYMSFIYFEVWQIKENRKADFEKSMVGFNKNLENNLLNASTPFAFWEIGESNFFRFLKLIGCDNSKIGNYKNSVEDRNNAAHSNGRIFFNDQSIIDRKIDEVLRFIDDIQTHSQPLIEECLIKFLKESNNPDKREYFDDADQIREILINGNYLSQKDIEYMLKYDITKLLKKPKYEEMKVLFDAFVENYKLD